MEWLGRACGGCLRRRTGWGDVGATGKVIGTGVRKSWTWTWTFGLSRAAPAQVVREHPPIVITNADDSHLYQSVFRMIRASSQTLSSLHARCTSVVGTQRQR